MNKIEKNKKAVYFYSLTTNFKPNNLNNFQNFNLLDQKNEKIDLKKNLNQRITCRNFFLFFILLQYNNKKNLNKSSFFIKPLKRNLQTILRAPYRHKLSRHQLTLTRYNIIFKIVLDVKRIIKSNSFKNTKKIFRTFYSYNRWVESNIISNYKIKFYFTFNYPSNFNLKNFNFTKNKN